MSVEIKTNCDDNNCQLTIESEEEDEEDIELPNFEQTRLFKIYDSTKMKLTSKKKPKKQSKKKFE